MGTSPELEPALNTGSLEENKFHSALEDEHFCTPRDDRHDEQVVLHSRGKETRQNLNIKCPINSLSPSAEGEREAFLTLEVNHLNPEFPSVSRIIKISHFCLNYWLSCAFSWQCSEWPGNYNSTKTRGRQRCAQDEASFLEPGVEMPNVIIKSLFQLYLLLFHTHTGLGWGREWGKLPLGGESSWGELCWAGLPHLDLCSQMIGLALGCTNYVQEPPVDILGSKPKGIPQSQGQVLRYTANVK